MKLSLVLARKPSRRPGGRGHLLQMTAVTTVSEGELWRSFPEVTRSDILGLLGQFWAARVCGLCGWDWRGYPGGWDCRGRRGGSVGRILDNLIQANPGRRAAGSACMAVIRKALCGGP